MRLLRAVRITIFSPPAYDAISVNMISRAGPARLEGQREQERSNGFYFSRRGGLFDEA